MRSGTIFINFVIVISLIFLGVGQLGAKNVIIDNFEDYASNTDLTGAWKVFGDASLTMEIEWDETGTLIPGGEWVKCTYNATSSAWGAAIEPIYTNYRFTSFPKDMSVSEAGFQMYLKGDGTSNTLRIRYYNGNEIWRSSPISLTDTEWHIVRIPFEIDLTDNEGFHLWDSTGTNRGTLLELKNSLLNVERFQLYLDHPNASDASDYAFYIDGFRSVDFFPPDAPVQFCLTNFEDIPNTETLKANWQCIGYPTRDYALWKENDTPEGYRNLYWLYQPDDATTWGIAFKSRPGIVNNLDVSDAKDGGMQFLMKGDGSPNTLRIRWTDTDNNYWVSTETPCSDTTWHWVCMPFIVSTTIPGFRWCGNSPDSTYWGPIIGTIDELQLSLTHINEIRFDIREPEKDGEYYAPQLDAVYVVSELPPNEPISVDNFEAYADNSGLALSWNQFGDGMVSFGLSEDSPTAGQAMQMSYNGVNGYMGVRKRNIIPAHNFADQSAGIQFYLKGDGSNNNVVMRIYSGDEMWESYKIPLKSTAWKHWAIKFKADSTNGFRYLGDDPNEPIYSNDVGSRSQLYGNLSSIDQVRFYVHNPEEIDQVFTFAVDNIEAMDEFDTDIQYELGIPGNNDGQVPVNYTLKQNYPNPFNPMTTLEYSLNKSGIVSLDIYNIKGQQVKTLVNSYQPSGNYQVHFDATNGFASGIYFYRLLVKDTYGRNVYSDVKRMLLIK